MIDIQRVVFWWFCVLFIWFIKSFAETNNIAIDCRNCSAEEILRLLLDTYPSLYDTANRKLVYVCATCDVEERLRKHNVDIDDVIFCAMTASRRVAARVEELAREMGFCIGQ